MIFSFQVMSSIIIILTGFLWTQVTYTGADPYITDYDAFTSCGGSLPISPLYATVVKIGYYDPVCVWRLLPEGTITKLSMEITSNANSTITGFVAFHWNGNDFSTSKIPLGNATVTFDTVPLLLSFCWRGIAESSLTVRLISEGSAGARKASHHFRFKAAPGKFIYPKNADHPYIKNKLVTVILSNFNASAFGVKEVTVRSVNLEPRYDMLKVFTLFTPWDPLFFKNIGTLTEDDVQVHSSINWHHTVILFKSERFNRSKGFSVQWKFPEA